MGNSPFIMNAPFVNSQNCYYCNPSFRLVTKAKVCKSEGQERNLGVTYHAPRNVEECEGMTPTLPNEFPLWELNSQRTPKFSENDWRGQNPLN